LKDIKIFSGSSHPELVERIAERLKIEKGSLENLNYGNNCFEIILKDNVENKIVLLVQTSTVSSCGDRLYKHFWELFEMIDAAKENGARKVIVIMPYNSYARSDKIPGDKKFIPGMNISARLLVRLMIESGMDGFIGFDFHSDRFRTFFPDNIACHQISTRSLLIQELKKRNLENAILLPGDEGAKSRANIFGEELGLLTGTVEKKRIPGEEPRVEIKDCDTEGKTVIITDDEISTGGTMNAIMKEAQEMGAKDFILVAAHGLFAGKAIDNFQKNKALKEIIVTDTIPIRKEIIEKLPLTVVPVDEILAKEIESFFETFIP